jgi:2-dehydro-3-deoxyglucarate aldolase
MQEAQAPLLIAQIEHIRAVDNLESILSVEGLDAIFIGPYDLSASMGLTGQFEHPRFKEEIARVVEVCKQRGVPSGLHVVNPDPVELQTSLDFGYTFVAYSIDSVFLSKNVINPI